jgi:gliding motility-associated-like protein
MLCQNNLVFIPTAFSPNGDGLNNRFLINGTGLKTTQSIVIYNRWGSIVFERKQVNIRDINGSWNGTVKEEALPIGPYVYQVITECEAGDHFSYKGNVTIKR